MNISRPILTTRYENIKYSKIKMCKNVQFILKVALIFKWLSKCCICLSSDMPFHLRIT